MHPLAVLCGALFGAFGPRRRALALLLLSALVPLGAFVAALFFARLSIGVAALAFFAGAVAVAVLAHALPRVALFVFLLASVPLGGVVVGGAPRWALGVFGIALLAAAVVLAFRAGVGMRVACALAGARLISLGLRGAVPLWQTLAIALALFAIGTAIRRAEENQPRLRLAFSAGFGAAVGLALGGGTLLALALAEVVAPTSRSEGLAAGLVWPLPSEAILWEDRTGFSLLDHFDAAWLGAARRGVAKLPGTSVADRFSLHPEIVRRREIKDDAELQAMRTAARATVEALHDVAPLVQPGEPEADLARSIVEAMRKHGCDGGPSFPPIVAAGARAAIPHGTGNSGTLHEGDLVLIDVGCLARGYASDVTRTVAVGRTTDRQRAVLEAVVAAQQAAAKACRPGVRLLGRNDPGSLDGIARAEIRRRGFEDHNPFGIGHTVGLFVHDVGPSSTLRPGMVITLEPGIYLSGELGVRIEDEYLVTKDGCEPLTGSVARR